MNQRRARDFRKIFKNRAQYKAYKKAYTKASLPKQLETLAVVDKILSSGKMIKVKEM